MYKNVLVATDGSALAARAVEHGVELAKALNTKLFLLTVTEQFRIFAIEAEQLEETPTSFREHMKRQAERILAAAADVAAKAGIDAVRSTWRTTRPIRRSYARRKAGIAT